MISYHHHISTISTISTIRAPFRDKLLSPKVYGPISTISRCYIYLNSIYQVVYSPLKLLLVIKKL